MKRRMNRVMDRDSDHVLDRSDLAVSLATLKAAPKPKPKLRPVDYAARFAIEKGFAAKALLQRLRVVEDLLLNEELLYAEQCACCGDAHACLQRALARVPHDVQWRVRKGILDTKQRNARHSGRQARPCMPRDTL